MSTHTPEELQRMYGARFSSNLEYRKQVWTVLVADTFSRYVQPTDSVLDLGCGYGEFINTIRCREKFGMDLNPDTARFLANDVTFLQQDCSLRWQVPTNRSTSCSRATSSSIWPDKAALGRVLDEVGRCLRPGGRLIALGPNIKYLHGAYWDFWDHYVPITEASLTEALVTRRFSVDVCVGRFLPYTMA